MTVRSAASLAGALALCVSSWVAPAAWGQASAPAERATLMLPADPFQWHQLLNDWGQKGWEVQGVQQPVVGGLLLHLVTFVRTPGGKPVSHAVLVAEFPDKADATNLAQTRRRLEIQTNQHALSGWQLIQVATGRLAQGQHFIALILKKL